MKIDKYTNGVEEPTTFAQNEDGETAKRVAVTCGFDNVVYRGEWKGYKVYDPKTEDGEVAYTGLPVMILVKDGTGRLTHGEEIFACFNAVMENEE